VNEDEEEDERFDFDTQIFEHPAGATTRAFEHHVRTDKRAKRTRRIMAENVIFVCGFLAVVTLFRPYLHLINVLSALDG